VRRERRQPTRAEWQALTSGEAGPVVRRIPPSARRGEQLFAASQRGNPAPPLDRSSLMKVRQVKEDKVIELSTRTSEAAEAGLTRFIERRDGQRRQTKGERLEEYLWMETVREYHERERQSLLWERPRYHEAMLRAHTATHRAIIARHRARQENDAPVADARERDAR
jgi:hypothetical protein